MSEFDEKAFADWWEQLPGIASPYCVDVIEYVKPLFARDKARIAQLEKEIERLRADHRRQLAKQKELRLARKNAMNYMNGENKRMRAALERIVACDYRGNMPREQSIARQALTAPEAAEGEEA